MSSVKDNPSVIMLSAIMPIFLPTDLKITKLPNVRDFFGLFGFGFVF